MNHYFFISAFLGSTSVYYLNTFMKNSVRSASLLTLLSFLILKFLINIEADLILILSAFYGGAFIGMTSHTHVSFLFLLISSIIFTLFFIYLIPFLGGFGGGLGICAFLSVFLMTSFKKVISMKK